MVVLVLSVIIAIERGQLESGDRRRRLVATQLEAEPVHRDRVHRDHREHRRESEDDRESE